MTPSEMLTIHPDNLEKDMETHLQYAEKIASESAKAKSEAKRLKLLTKAARGTKFLKLKKEVNSAGKGYTEKEIDSLLDVDQELIDQQIKLIEAEQKADYLGDLVGFFHDRTTLLANLNKA